jgi:hypothetical protein
MAAGGIWQQVASGVAGGCVVGQHGGEQLPQLVVLLLHGLLVVLLMLL